HDRAGHESGRHLVHGIWEREQAWARARLGRLALFGHNCHRVLLLVVLGRSGPLEAAFQVPHSSEVVERASGDLTRPVERVRAGGGVVGAPRTGRVPGPTAAGLGRALVEVLTVPGRGEGAEISAQARPRQRDARSRYA